MMKWITAADIKNWARTKSRHCQETMPELLRRLIFATATSIEKINFPCGDSVSTGGWDGMLETTSTAPFFPQGVSGWETGVEASAGTKAEGDYRKRTDDSLGLIKSQSTFVFVTPRAWPGRIAWEESKKAEKHWKSVQVIAADDLELWLASAPAVALWLARQIGKVISAGVRDLEAVWEEWSEGTHPKMIPEMVISGRTKDTEAVHRWINQEPSILEVQGDNSEEAVAFLYSAIAGLPEEQRLQALSRCVVVGNINEVREVTRAFQNFPLIIVAPGECVDAASAATAKGHHVYLSMDATVIGVRDVLRLGRPQRKVVENILHEKGLSKAKAQQIARDSGRSIPVLRRHLFRSKVVRTPSWVTAESANVLIPLLLTGAWDEHKEGDRRAIETLSGLNHGSFLKALIPLLAVEDSPIRKVGSVWMLKSPLDAWFLLAQFLTQDVLKLFETTVLAVLTNTDPKYDLEAEKRWAAALYGKSNPFSEWLRTGLVESLVLIAVYGNRSPHFVSTEGFAGHVVKEVFAKADKWEAWASVKDVTPLLAEAAPDAFMEVVELGIKKGRVLFQELLKDDGGLFGECRHSGLLWALEGIAWSTEYFGRAVNILLELAGIDEGGKWSNRPINSLADIFLPGFPQTHATPEDRLAALDNLIRTNPQLVWKFAQRYYIDGHISESHRFCWRDTGGIRRGLEPEKNPAHSEYLIGLLPKLSDLACQKENLISSVDEFTRLPEEIRSKLLAVLEAADVDSFAKDELSKILRCVRKALNWINSYGDEDHRKHVSALYRVMGKFTPIDVLERTGWLLSDPWPQLPEGEIEDYEAEEEARTKAREQAAREVLDKASMEEIIEFARTIQYVGVLGHALGKVVRDENEDANVLDSLIERSMDKPLLIQCYAQGRIEVVGRGWVDRQIARMKVKGNYSAESCALLYSGLPEGSSTWSAVRSQGKEVESAYWKRASGRSRESKKGDAAIAVEKLLDAKRPDAALDIAGDRSISIPSAILERLLQELLEAEEKTLLRGGADGYRLGYVFRQLYEQDELPIEKLAVLEWPFAAFFDEIKRYAGVPIALHRLLQKDPAFFAQLVSFIYKRDDRSPDPENQGVEKIKIENRALAAREVLDSWSLFPGMKEDGTLSEEGLAEWIEAVRKTCEETMRVTGGDLQIAAMLAHAPSDADGTWPHAAVRNIIERLDNEVIDEHIQIEVCNSRGVTSRGITDGGKQERELAEKYKGMSDAVKAKWPRTGAILRSIARYYEDQAKREDIDSDLNDLRWD